MCLVDIGCHYLIQDIFGQCFIKEDGKRCSSVSCGRLLLNMALAEGNGNRCIKACHIKNDDAKEGKESHKYANIGH